MKIHKWIALFTVQMIGLLAFGQNTKIDSLLQLGVEMHETGRFQEAIKQYKKALVIDPNSSVVYYEMAYSSYALKDYKNAIKYSKKVIELNEEEIIGGYLLYGTCLDLTGKKSEAIQVYEKAITRFDNYLLCYNLATVYLNSGLTDKAYESVLKALNINPNHSSSHLLLSSIMEKKGNRLKAMLPLYYFLLLEPNTDRSKPEYQRLLRLMNEGVNTSSDKSVNVSVPFTNDPDFGAAEMMVSLAKAADNLEENKDKPELQLFAERNKKIFSILGELKKDHTGFWWDFYVARFSDLNAKNLTDPFSYYISATEGPRAISWFDRNPGTLKKLKTWISNE